jgi:hypothetical protein
MHPLFATLVKSWHPHFPLINTPFSSFCLISRWNSIVIRSLPIPWLSLLAPLRTSLFTRCPSFLSLFSLPSTAHHSIRCPSLSYVAPCRHTSRPLISSVLHLSSALLIVFRCTPSSLITIHRFPQYFVAPLSKPLRTSLPHVFQHHSYHFRLITL